MSDIVLAVIGILIIGGVLYYLFRVGSGIFKFTKGRKTSHQILILGLIALTGFLSYKFGMAAGLPTILVAAYLLNRPSPNA